VSLPIITAVSDARSEADLARGLSGDEHGVQLVRRCVDLADLLAAAAAGLARAAVLSADLRRLDRDALTRLELAHVAVVGLVAPGDAAAERRIRQLGVERVLPLDAPAGEVSAAVHAAVSELGNAPGSAADLDWGDPGGAAPRGESAASAATATKSADADAEAGSPAEAGSVEGRVIAVWGPAGSPGRSTIAVNLAAELAGFGRSALLVDADPYGGVVAQLIGVLDEAPGLAAAARLAHAGSLDVPRLTDVALELRPELRVLTGITRAERWLELRPAAISVVLDLARAIASVTVVDCGFCLEQDEELAYDTAAPRRNGATLAVLGAADIVVGVAAADPIGLARYVRALPDCVAATSAAAVTVVNRLRPGVVGRGDPRRQVAAALSRYAGIGDIRVVPDDREALDAAIAAGRTLAEVAPKSPARLAIRDLAAHLVREPDEEGVQTGRRRHQRPARRRG
jgi:MinD-like ATPase involved in chromosome partitioning or flagellar assembly